MTEVGTVSIEISWLNTKYKHENYFHKLKLDLIEKDFSLKQSIWEVRVYVLVSFTKPTLSR